MKREMRRATKIDRSRHGSPVAEKEAAVAPKRTSKSLMKRLDKYFYPNYNVEEVCFCQHIEKYLYPNSVVLDAGAGSGRDVNSFRYDYKNRVKCLIGCDISPNVKGNPNLHIGTIADLESLPFPDEHFDLIFSCCVVEHLANPSRVFKELSRVLKQNGHIVIWTPNLHHYVTLISRFSPQWLHEMFYRSSPSPDVEPFPTFYRANTRSRLVDICANSGLEIETYRTIETRPHYLTMSPLTYAAGIAYERLVNRFELLSDFRVAIILVARKCAS